MALKGRHVSWDRFADTGEATRSLQERVDSCRKNLAGLSDGQNERAVVTNDRCYAGWDAYKKLDRKSVV